MFVRRGNFEVKQVETTLKHTILKWLKLSEYVGWSHGDVYLFQSTDYTYDSIEVTHK